MGFGFSFGPAPVQPPPVTAAGNAMMSSAAKPQIVAKDFEIIARQTAVTNLFFGQINVNHRYVSRMAVFASLMRDDDSFDKKRKRDVIPRLKPHASEAMHHFFK